MKTLFPFFQKTTPNKNTVTSKPPYSFQHIANDLLTLPDTTFDAYVFEREPLCRKIPTELQLELAEKSRNSGIALAKQLQKTYPSCTPQEICSAMGLIVIDNQEPQHSFQIVYGQFVQPDQITLFSHCLQTVSTIAAQSNSSNFPTTEQLRQIILAHELYHALEEQTPELFAAAYRLPLWKVGPFHNDSPVLCLSEIAGMAFAKQLCNIPFSPYALDALLLYGYDAHASCDIYQEVMSYKT